MILRISKENPSWTLQKIAKEARVQRKTVGNVLKRFNETLSIARKPGSGRKPGFVDRKLDKQVEVRLEKNPRLSNRKLANKVGCSDRTVRRVKTKLGFKTYKVQTVPDRNAKKNLEAKKRARKLRKEYFQKVKCCLMDDETYVLGNFSQLPGQDFYSARERAGVPEQFRTKQKSKFPRKFLVWQAICSCGDRTPSFVTNGTINSDIYIQECLKKRLLPFMKKHNVSTFFWPDLASAHYSKKTLEWYRQNNVTLVPKEANPPNCPELRPIEKYWALVKQILKKTNREVKDMTQFKLKWNAATKKVSKETIKTMMERVPEKISEFCKH